jgi:DNA (cytosine-5)-methyltransferase 1
MKIGSLCTGYGGLDMAVEAFFNAETVWTCEFDKYASQVIEKRIDKPNHGDLKKTDWTKVESIDILTAGYPCQPFSTAGSRKGADDERHLWPYIKEIIGILRPQFVVLENVRGHFGLGFREVLGDLASIGYDATWRLVRASDVGAPHRRERLFILVYSQSGRSRSKPSGISSSYSGIGRSSDSISEYTNTNGQRCSLVEEIATNTNGDACAESRRANRELRTESSGLRGGQNKGQAREEYSVSSQTLSDTSCQCISSIGHVPELGRRFTSRRDMHLQAIPDALAEGRLNAKFVEYMMGLPDGWVTDVGLSRSQQLKILGNGVVPQQAEYALELLWETYVTDQY